MRESSIYQDILSEGKVLGKKEGNAEGNIEGRLALILRLGAKRWGKPTELQLVTLKAITDSDRLDYMADLLDQVANWRDLIKKSKTPVLATV